MRRISVVILLAGMTLGFLLLLAVTQEWVGSPIARHVLSRLETGGGAVVTSEGVRFRGLEGVSLVTVRWSRGDTLLAAADTLAMDWPGWRLLGRTVDIDEIRLSGFRLDPIALTRWLESLVPLPGAARPRWTPQRVRVGRVRFEGVRLAALPSEARMVELEALSGGLEDIAFESGRLRVRDGRIQAGWRLARTGMPGRFEAAGSWDDGRLSVASFRIRTERSLVTGRAAQSFRGADSVGELQLRIERLRLEDFAPFLAAGDSLRAAWYPPGALLTGTADLRGARPEFWSGPLRLTATGLRPAGVPLDSLVLAVDLKNGLGTADLAVRAALRPAGWLDPAAVAADGGWADSTWAGPVTMAAGPARLEARGTVDLRNGPRITLSAGRFAGLDPARLGLGSLSGRLAGGFDLDWSGRGGACVGRLDLTLEPATLAGHAFDGATAALRLAGSRLSGDAVVRAGGGELRVTGGTVDFAGDVRLDLPLLTVRPVDPRRLVRRPDATPAGDWNGRVALDVVLRPRAFPRAGESWGVALARGAAGGRVRVDLEPSRAAGLDIFGGWGEASLAAGALEVDLDLTTAAGGLALRGGLEDLGGSGAWRIDALDARRLDVSRLPAPGLPVSALTGNLTATGNGWSFTDLRVSGGYRLEPSGWAGTELRSGRGTLEVRNGILILDGRLALPWGVMEFAASQDRSQRPPRTTFGATVGLTELLSLTRRPLPDTDGEIVLTGDGYGTDAAHWTGSVDLIGSGRLGRARIPQLRLPIRVADGTATLDSVDFVAPWARLSGAGSVVFADSAAGRMSDLALHLRVLDARPLAGLAGLDTLEADTLALRFTARGPARALTLDGVVEASGVRAGPTRLRSGRLTATARLAGEGGAGLAAATAHLVLVEPRWGAFRSEGLTLDLEDDGARSQIGLELETGSGPRLTAAASIALRGQEKTLTLAALDLTGGRAAWKLEAPASIRFGRGYARVDTLQLRSGQGLLNLTGGLAAAGSQDLRLRLQGFPLAGAAALKGRPDLDGTLTARLDVTGPADAPELQSRFDLDVRRNGREFGRIEAWVQNTAGHLVIDGRLAPTSGAPLVLSGSLPFRLRLDSDSPRVAPRWVNTAEAFDLSLRSEGFDLAVLTLLLDPDAAVLEGGRLTLNSRIRGTAVAPTAEGPMRLTARGFSLPGLGLKARDVSSDWTLGDGRLHLTRLVAHAGGGRLTGAGDLRWSRHTGPTWELRADLARFQVAEARDWSARLTGSGKVSSHGDTLRVAGRFTAQELEYFFTPTGAGVIPADVALTDDDYRTLERTFGRDFRTARPADRWWNLLGLDLDVTLGRNSWYRQRGEPRMAVELTGPLRLAKEPGGALNLHGRLEPIPGRGFVEQFGRRFDVQGGTITLDGDPLALDLEVKTQYQTPPSRDTGEAPITVTMDVKGTLDRLKLEFSSDPPLTNTEIVSVIATGTPGGVNPTASGGNGGDAAGTAAQIGLSRLTGAVEELAERNIGLDVVQIRQDGLRGATLVAGKYLTPRFYLGFRQPVSFETQTTGSTESGRRAQFELEYSAWRWLLVNLQGEGSRFQGFLRGRYAF